jgi:cation diffusion facilitator family transporter
MQDVKQRAAIVSVFVSAALTAAKFVVAFVTGSLALLTDALHSLLDVGATLMTLYAVREAAKPADSDHNFGHGKVESITALIEVGLLAAISLYAIAEGAHRLITGAQGEVTVGPLAIAVLLVAIVVDYLRARALRRVAVETSSAALASNALHFSADMWQSIAVLFALGLVAAGFPQADSVGALMVAGFILFAARGLARSTIDTLMDAAPSGVGESVRRVAAGVRGVVSIEAVRVRRVGPDIMAEVDAVVPRTFTSERIAEIRADVAAAVAAEVAGAKTIVVVEPRAVDRESALERILLIAATKRVPVHHVTVQEIDGRLAVALDVEVDGRMSLEAAHVIASRLETAIRDAFGMETEVETHIEPMDAKGLPGHDVPEAERRAIADTIHLISAHHTGVGAPHDVRARDTERGRVVVLHCYAPPKSTVADVHASVDALEREIRAAYPDVARLVIHAEPRR